MEETVNQRVRMNINLTAKGLVQWDITAEFPTVEETKDNLDKALKEVKKVIVDNGYTEAGK